MRDAEFDALAERCLIAALGPGVPRPAESLAKEAVEVAEALALRLLARRTERFRKGLLTLEEAEMCRDRRKILAIKSVRERTGMSLKDSKDYVDRACRDLGLE